MRERYVNVADADAASGDIPPADEELVAVSDNVGVIRDDTSGIACKVGVYIDLLCCCKRRSPVVNANDARSDDVDVVANTIIMKKTNIIIVLAR